MYINIRFRRPFYWLLIAILLLAILFIIRQDLFLDLLNKISYEIKYFVRHMLRRSIWRVLLWNT